jgi:transposase InsO family protein
MLEKYQIRVSMCNEVYENTHIERVNDTIKNQYLKRMEIRNKEELKKKLVEAIKAYNETRPHQSLRMMSPMEYEKYLLNIEKEKRHKMKIYTIEVSKEEQSTTQLNLFEKS